MRWLNAHKTTGKGTSLALILFACVSTVSLAGPDKKCNGDAPVHRCPGNDEFTSYGTHVLTSGVDACAAIVWTSGWPVRSASLSEDDENFDKLTDVERHTDIVTPEGVSIPQRGVHQPTTEIEACWVLRQITGKSERPVALRDARKPFELQCSENPPNLQSALPGLSAIGRVTIDPRARRMSFFGAQLGLIPHAGSAYLGMSKDFAVTLGKQSGAYTVFLPGGHSLSGRCEVQSEER